MKFNEPDRFVIEMLRDDRPFAVEYLKEALAQLDSTDGETLLQPELKPPRFAADVSSVKTQPPSPQAKEYPSGLRVPADRG